MNRLTEYFENAKLAKMMVLQAEDKMRHNDLRMWQLSVTSALTYLIAAMNNVASIGFNKKPRRKHHAKKRHALGGIVDAL